MSFDSGVFGVTTVLKAQPFLRFILLFGSICIMYCHFSAIRVVV